MNKTEKVVAMIAVITIVVVGIMMVNAKAHNSKVAATPVVSSLSK